MVEIVTGSLDGVNRVWQSIPIGGCYAPPVSDPTVEVGKFNAQDRSLDFVHARSDLPPITKPVVTPC
jgi:hypothetical protein